ncbi:hypothetical protein MKY04_12010 [Lysinibacillus telephonicus]|uniref:hypothetical protein n=1 Tax=Lysinibacillus telephonicus TaxID=1714840 RepID=UPI0031FCE0A9
MAEIKTAGYQAIRDYIQANWKFIELRDDNGVAVLRADTTDSRVTFTHQAGSQTLELQIVVTGSDSDITLPQTFASCAIYDVAVDGTAFSEENFTSFTMEGTGDQLTVKHQIQIPQVVVEEGTGGDSGWGEW